MTALTGLTARTGLLRVLERPLTSIVVPFPKPLQMLLLLTDKDLYRPSSNEVVPAVCRSAWDLTLRDIWKRAGRRCESRTCAQGVDDGNVLSFMSADGSAAASHSVFMSCET